MRTKSFQQYLSKRLTTDEMAHIEKQAAAEIKVLRALQRVVMETIDSYMQENNIGFNELVRRLNASPAHVAKIKRGEANLTLASLAHIFSMLGQEPTLIFKVKK